MRNKSTFLSRKGFPALPRGDITSLEQKLDVILPEDFKNIADVCDYEYLGSTEWLNFSLDGPQSVAYETKQFRDLLHLPHRYVVLRYTGDTQVILMETQNATDKPAPIISCEQEDLENLITGAPLQYNPTIWPSFTDFFEYLVEQEEAKLKDDA